MFSNDQNIETIAQLAEEVKRYLNLQTKYVKLDAVEKIVRLLTVITMTVILGLLLILALIYLSFSVANALQPMLSPAVAFLCVAGFYILLLALCIIFRKRWIEKPLVRFLASLLTE